MKARGNVVKGNLRFTRKTLQKEICEDIATPIRTNSDYSRLLVMFGDATDDVTVVELSDDCFAFVEGSRWVGFFVTRLEDQSDRPPPPLPKAPPSPGVSA
ncbi:MAG: hypothetical protein ACR2JC_11165 [Chloroflexota bacterium]|nr:MAG: hypothetical protein DLM70_09540 [Chloroflexota bacterium]